ncbi:MAG: hypothetical protein WC372_11495 [Candidatus Neomarinimicrobiota bacterium]|jgi:hypothetical protein
MRWESIEQTYPRDRVRSAEVVLPRVSLDHGDLKGTNVNQYRSCGAEATLYCDAQGYFLDGYEEWCYYDRGGSCHGYRIITEADALRLQAANK